MQLALLEHRVDDSEEQSAGSDQYRDKPANDRTCDFYDMQADDFQDVPNCILSEFNVQIIIWMSPIPRLLRKAIYKRKSPIYSETGQADWSTSQGK